MKINLQNKKTNEESFDRFDMAILRALLHDSRKTLQEGLVVINDGDPANIPPGDLECHSCS